ncbi:MAG: hypothetical protein AB2A00_37075 [Myxococcota bacterium]
MKHTEALWSGIIAGAVTTLLMALARLAGIPVDVEMALGSLPFSRTGPVIWVFGVLLFLLGCGMVGQLYAAGFELVSRRSGWRVGALMSVAHMALSGVLLGALSAVHPLIPAKIAAPGAFMASLGVGGIAVFLVTHVVFGALMGSLYVPRAEELEEELDAWVGEP